MSADPHPPPWAELGSAYRSVKVLAGGELGVATKDHLVTIFGAARTVVHLDLEGRLHRAWLGDRSYQRGLDGRVRRVTFEGEGRDRSIAIEIVSPGLAAGVFAQIGELVAAAHAALPADVEPVVAETLALALGAFAPSAVEGEAAKFRAAYDPIPILPPDRNRALVIQLTSGCSWNRCTFCHLYRDTRFSMKTPESLADHIGRVLGVVGRALPLRRGVFLGQANALVIARDKLLPLIDVVNAELRRASAPAAFRSLSAFVDAFSSPKRVEEWAELRQRGLESVSLGLESGSDDVLATLGKPAESAGAVRLVEQLREAGIGVGVIVLAGAGGARWQERHVGATVEVIARMGLRKGDRVYLSPLQVEQGSGFQAAFQELGTLCLAEIEAQANSIRAGLRAAGVSVPVARYDIRRFVY